MAQESYDEPGAFDEFGDEYGALDASASESTVEEKTESASA